MSKGKKEVTKIIERFELLEEKRGITIGSLYATSEYEPDEPAYYRVVINFDVNSIGGGKLDQDGFFIKASAYNASAQLLGVGHVSLYNHQGFSSETISILLDQEPVRIRLYPS